MIRRGIVAAAILAGITLAGGIAGGHQTTGKEERAGAPAGAKCGANVTALPDDGTDGALYIDNRYVTEGGAFSVWVYQEANGHPGLQTKANSESVILGPDDTEICTTSGHLDLEPDMLIL